MEIKERLIWFDIFMYTVMLICILYIIKLNQMQKYFMYIILIVYIIATSYKILTLTHLKQEHNSYKENKK